MIFSFVASIAKHFLPANWFPAIIKEAEQAPATVAGFFMLWVALISVVLFAFYTYRNDVQASELKLASLEATISANTVALDCNAQNSWLNAKQRQINRLQQLIDRTEDPTEKRDLELERAELQSDYDKRDRKFERECL